MPAATIRCREMKMDTQRLILLFIFSFSLLMLWEAWNKQGRPTPAPAAPSAQQGVPAPKPAAPEAASKPAASTVPGAEASAKGETIRVTTDLVVAELDTLGATLKRVELLQHKDSRDPTKPFVLLGAEHQYEAQSGLAGDAGPNHRSLWRVQQGERSLAPGRDAVEVKFSASGKDGLEVTKTYTFKRDSYVIDVALELRNAGAAAASTYAYFQLTHDGKPDTPTNSVASTFGAQSFIGFGVYTDEHKYQKVHLSDLDKGKTDLHVKQADNGWLAFVQHYFVSAWLPPEAAPRDYVTEKRPDGTYAGRLMFPASVAPGASARVSAPLYAGPQEQRRLRAAAPGLDLVVDYGWLAIIAWPLFWLLQQYHSLSANWGVAIILLTVTVKLLFFPLSAASYKSMAKMKLVTPRLTKIREQYAHDRQKMNQAMMELYKTEKINLLGGCFPIVVQIPVFIALYWVLLAAIELRHAPFVLWIHDLSALDPYYVLPILMSCTMVLQ